MITCYPIWQACEGGARFQNIPASRDYVVRELPCTLLSTQSTCGTVMRLSEDIGPDVLNYADLIFNSVAVGNVLDTDGYAALPAYEHLRDNLCPYGVK